jgi:hypothetical protein
MRLPGINAAPAAREKAWLAGARTDDNPSLPRGATGVAEPICHTIETLFQQASDH